MRPSQDCGTVDPSAQMLTSSAQALEGTLEDWANVRRRLTKHPSTVFLVLIMPLRQRLNLTICCFFSTLQIIVHEWGHLRYGVYDEYAEPNARQFYAVADGGFEGVRCSLSNRGNL